MEITFTDLSFRYGGKRSPLALDGINAVIGPGIHLLLGENGAGKTTLLHLIDGLLFPGSGKCLIDGGPTQYRLPSVLSKVFYLGAGMPLPAATIGQLAEVHGQFYPTLSTEMLDENLRDFGLDPTQKLDNMSMGTRQKAAVAYALALRTNILLLDEPATGLSIRSKQKLLRMLARCIEPEQTVIIATHNIADMQNLYESLMVLDHGRLMLSMPTDEILQRIAFVRTTGSPVDGALYSTTSIDGRHSIVANDGSIDSEIDYQLLYSALHHDPATQTSILNQLMQK